MTGCGIESALLSMCSCLLSIWRSDSVIKPFKIQPWSTVLGTNRLVLTGWISLVQSSAWACSGSGRTTLTVSRSMSRTFIPGPLFSIILVTYCFTASVTFMVAMQKSKRHKNEENDNTAENLWREPAEQTLQKRHCWFTSWCVTSSPRLMPRHAVIHI